MSRRFKLTLVFAAQMAFHVAWNIAWVAYYWNMLVDRSPIGAPVMLTAPTRADHTALIMFAVARALFALILSAFLTSWLAEEIFGKEKER